MSARAVRCIGCHIWLVPFGERDIADVVLEHLNTIHGDATADVIRTDARMHPNHPSHGYLPEPVA